MANIIVGVGDLAISDRQGDVIKTFALGSCIAVMFYSPKFKLAGMAHVALPESEIDLEKARKKPGHFADTAIPYLVNEFRKYNILQNYDIQVKIVGGASIMDPNNHFNIGKRNAMAIKKMLWQYRLGAVAEDIGKDYSRTVSMDVDSGLTIISSPKLGDWKL